MRPDPYDDPYSRANYQPMTPVDCERHLARLKNSVTQAELLMRERHDAETDALVAYKKAHLIATTDPDCPLVSRGGATVAERDDWIMGQEFDEWTAWTQTKKDLKKAQEYQDRLETQVSITQTQSKFVLQAYAVAGTS